VCVADNIAEAKKGGRGGGGRDAVGVGRTEQADKTACVRARSVEATECHQRLVAFQRAPLRLARSLVREQSWRRDQRRPLVPAPLTRVVRRWRRLSPSPRTISWSASAPSRRGTSGWSLLTRTRALGCLARGVPRASVRIGDAAALVVGTFAMHASFSAGVRTSPFSSVPVPRPPVDGVAHTHATQSHPCDRRA